LSDAGRGLLLFSPAGVLRSVVPLRRAAARLGKLGFSVSIDADATARMQRFAGDDETRLAALHRIAGLRPSVALQSSFWRRRRSSSLRLGIDLDRLPRRDRFD